MEGYQNGKIEAVLAKIARFTVRSADRIIALGDTMKRRLMETKNADPGKIRIIHNWADAQAVQPGPQDNAYSREHDLAGKFVVMHSGNVGMSQDVDGLLDTAERLKDLPDLVVAIVGEGSRKKFLQEDAQRRQLTNVRFFPYTPKSRLAESFATADVFIVALKRGLAGFIVPSKVYGILVAGRPFVAAVESDCEVAQIAREHDCGTVVEPGDRAQMAAALRALYNDRARCRQLADHARAAGLIYDRARAVEAYRDVLEEVAS
jgi:glycosyltransferase involved in cell wall biosynthesis